MREIKEHFKMLCKPSVQLLVVIISVLALNSCSETADTGVPVTIPSVRIQCTNTDCTTNGNGAITTAVVFTTSGCVAPDFGATLRYVSTSHSCNGSGCNFTSSSGAWTDNNGNSVSSIPSGTYSVCGCLDLNNSSLPFQNCDQESSYGPILVDSSTGTIFLTGWN